MSLESRYINFLYYPRIVSDDSTVQTTYGPAQIKKGFLQPLTGAENFKQGRAGEDVTAILFAPLSFSPDYCDKITYGGNDYLVLYGFQPDGVAGVGHHKEIKVGAFI